MRLLLASAAVAAFAADALAAPQPATATRAELARWLEGLRADVAAPLAWRHSFSADGSANLEALSVELVAAGYWIERLQPSTTAGMELAVTRVELLTPTSLERRNRDLAALARNHGARYVGVDVIVSGAR